MSEHPESNPMAGRKTVAGLLNLSEEYLDAAVSSANESNDKMAQMYAAVSQAAATLAMARKATHSPSAALYGATGGTLSTRDR